MVTAQEVELLRRQLGELNAQVDEVGQQSTNAAVKAGHESREARSVRSWQRL